MGGYPIRIDGWNNFALIGGVEGFTLGTFCGIGFGTSLKYGIDTIIDGLKRNAETYLLRMAEGLEDGRHQDLAFKIIRYKGDARGLFFLEYLKYCKEKIEHRLGKYAKLERIIAD